MLRLMHGGCMVSVVTYTMMLMVPLMMHHRGYDYVYYVGHRVSHIGDISHVDRSRATSRAV